MTDPHPQRLSLLRETTHEQTISILLFRGIHRRREMTDKQLSLEDVAHYPRPGMDAPSRVDFTPDSQKVTYLLGAPGSLVQELWTYDLANGERRQLTEMASDEVGATGTLSLN